MPKIVLTLLADDKPGLVRAVSDIVVSHHGNWLESRMAQLAGKFAGVILVEVADDQQAALAKALTAFADGDITVTTGYDGLSDEALSAVTLMVDGADHPGIVHEVTDLLVRRNINIREMETNHHAAAMSGQPLFSAEIHALLPVGEDQAALRAALDQLAGELMVDIDLQG